MTNEQSEIDKVVNMPFHTNNIDLTVNANSLFGLTQFMLTYPNTTYADEIIFDSDIKQLYTNVTSLLVWAIESDIIT